MGCVMQVGEQGVNIGRNAALAAGFPETTVGTTIDRQCGSSQQAAHFAAQGVMAGAYDVVIAAGVENMTRVPMGASMTGHGFPFGPKMTERYPNLVPQGISAELISEKWNISREDNDRFSVQSHKRAAKATDEGRFEREIVPISVTSEDGTVELVTRDEGIRPDSSMETLAKLKPAFKPDGVVTAANSSQITDGSAAVLIMSEEKAKERGLKPLATIRSYWSVASDPYLVGLAPVPAIKKILEETRLNLKDIQLFEINEAFAAYYLSCEKELGLNREITNVNGSGISLGHPVGCTGCRILVTLLYEMERQDLNLGISSLCAGGGVGTAILVER